MKKFVDLGKIGNIDFYQTNQYIISLLSIFEAHFKWYFGPYLGGGSGSNNYSTVTEVSTFLDMQILKILTIENYDLVRLTF